MKKLWSLALFTVLLLVILLAQTAHAQRIGRPHVRVVVVSRPVVVAVRPGMPARGYVWMRGHWQWHRFRARVWVPGYWVHRG